MRKMTYILLPLFLLVGLFIPISCEDAADDLAAALSGGDATLTGTWTVTGYQDKSGENCETTDESSTLFNGGTGVFTTTGLTMNTPMNIGVEGFCTLFFEGSVDGNTCNVPAECDCDDATSDDCDQNATTESACTTGGGDWDEAETHDITDTDFIAFLSSWFILLFFWTTIILFVYFRNPPNSRLSKKIVIRSYLFFILLLILIYLIK